MGLTRLSAPKVISNNICDLITIYSFFGANTSSQSQPHNFVPNKICI
ncbi:hypothetical protein Patl1_14650 [Pistacia atlantica]|uniref:Uncharacterized protein n=1 Tax=Pistacia atlantica TaxID=434234 RepID=A0ACC1ASG2_9ROSI|nr:hypothetical protein Patl1_14650 [Pistacia atlantica]